MDISIIIPIYRRTEWISKCINALLNQDYQGVFEVILIDDGSPNEVEIISAINKLLNDKIFLLKFIRNNHAGPAATRNYGVKFSSGELLCFIDDDSIPEKTWLREIINSFKENPQAGIVSGLTLSYYREKGLPLLLEKTIYSGKNWATCNIAYRRDVFEKLGGFDETFKEASWEDNELGLRAQWAGYLHIHNTNAVLYHPHERTIEEYIKKCFLNGRGAAVFSRKYLYKKPLWGIGTPFVMGRRLIYGLFPSVWKRDINDEKYLKFLWSYNSLQGFIKVLANW